MGSERTLHLRRWVALLLMAVSLLPAAALGAPPATRIGPEVPRPPRPAAVAPAGATLDLGVPLSDWLAVVADTDFSRRFLSFGDMQAWFEESGIERPLTADAVDALSEEDFKAVSFTLTSQAEAPPALGMEYLFVEDQAQRVGFSFFNANQYLWSMGAGNMLSLVRVQNDAAAIEAALLGSGYLPTPISGGTLWAKGEDNAFHMDSDFPTEQLGMHNRVAVFARGDGESDVLVARETDVLTTAVAAAMGEVDSLADDMGYRTLGGAVDAQLVPGQLVGLTMLSAAIPMPLPADVDDWDARMAKYAREPLPPYRIAAFATYRDGDDTLLTLYLVLAPGEDANSTATILRDRLEDYVTTVSDLPLADEFEVTERGSYISELEVAYVTLRVLEGEGQPFGWSRLINQRDVLFLAPGDEP